MHLCVQVLEYDICSIQTYVTDKEMKLNIVTTNIKNLLEHAPIYMYKGIINENTIVPNIIS